MSIIILFLHSIQNNNTITIRNNEKFTRFYERVAAYSERKLTIIRRADVNDIIHLKNVKVILRRDQFQSQLSWWQEPEDLFNYIATRNAEIIHVTGLDLPLHFRWLRKHVGVSPYILGQFTGEHIWPNIRIWMQQFGLRSADGFLFEDDHAADLWLKRAVVLPRQNIYKIKNLYRNPKSLAQVYLKILNQK
jgi:hypothetical protein